MADGQHSYLRGEELIGYLRQVFPNTEVISSMELREFLKISPSTDQRMRNAGKYPRTVSLPGVMREKRILLIDLAAWLEQGGCAETEGLVCKRRPKGRKESKTEPAEA